MKVSNLLTEYFQNSHSGTFNRIVESLPRSIPIEVKKSKWKREDNGFLSRSFSFDEQEDVSFFVSSLMKIIFRFSLSKRVSFFVRDDEVVVYLDDHQGLNMSETLDDLLSSLEKE